MDTTNKKKRPMKKKVHRALKKKEPKLVENTKVAMFIRGSKTSDTVNKVMAELALLKKPDIISMKKKNSIRPFEEVTSVEFLSNKNDASLFMFGSHSKKRPHNLVIGRLFDHQLLDMFELGIEDFKSLAALKGDTVQLGNKPLFLFNGDQWHLKEEYKVLSNLLVDFFRGPEVSEINLVGIEHAIVATATADKIYLRVYRIFLKKSGSKTPRIELSEMGPSIDLSLRRNRIGSDDLRRVATKKPKQLVTKEVKNVKTDSFGKQATIHMGREDISKLATMKMKGLKRKKPQENQSQKKQKSG